MPTALLRSEMACCGHVNFDHMTLAGMQSPRAVDGGLLKCFVTRERLRLGTVRFCMYLGGQSESPATAKFLLAALQTSR